MPLDFHEQRGDLPAEVIDQHRAIASLIEELEAAMWYHERAAVSTDPGLVGVMEHNRDEEIEHAAMLLETVRRIFPGFDEQLRTYLFTQEDLLTVEEKAEEAEAAEEGDSQESSSASGGDLGIGSLKEGA